MAEKINKDITVVGNLEVEVPPKSESADSFAQYVPEPRTFKKRFFREERTSTIEKEIIKVQRVVVVKRTGRSFSLSALILVRDISKGTVAYVSVKGKEMSTILRKAVKKSLKKMIAYFPPGTRTVPSDLTIKYKASKLIIKPAPEGTGIRAGGALSTFFKYLNLKDVSAKIIGSTNKFTVLRAAFMAMDKYTGKRYDY